MTSVASVLLAVLASAAVPPWQPPPAELSGLWFTDDRQGQQDCAAFKAASDPWQMEGILLIGALWIDGERLHRVAELGEGDFHQVMRRTDLSPTQWELEVVVGMDTLPDPEQDLRLVLQLTLTDGVLEWQEQLRQPVTRRWRRCTDTPTLNRTH